MTLAGRTLDRVYSFPRMPVLMAGTFTGNGTSDISTVDFKGVTTVTRSAQGEYNFAVPGSPSLYCVQLTIESAGAAADPKFATVTSYTGGTLSFEVFSEGATPTLSDLASNEKIHVLIVAKGSSVSTGQ